jgi:hypothetical protein
MKKTFFFLTLIAMTEITLAQNGLPVKKVTVFKNGTSLVIKEGVAAVKNGTVILPMPSQAIYGAYFVGAGKDNPIKNILVKSDTVKKPTKATELWQLVAANIGKSAVLSFAPLQKTDKSIAGKILDYNQQSGVIKLKQDNGKIAAINTTDLYLVELQDDENKNFMADSVMRSLVLKPQNPAESIALQEYYMQSGINWLPSYFLKLKDDKTARLEMKATLENFADELKDAETELVVGAPQMAFSGKADPLTYDYLTVDNGIDGNSRGYMNSNAMQMKAMSFDATSQTAGTFESTFTTEGEKSGDMYLYKIGKINLAKDAKGVFPIFAATVEYKDKYEGNIPDKTSFYQSRFCNVDETPHDVFHSLEIKNTSGVPLTTAPIMMINEKEQFLAQDQLKYTPNGAPTTVKLSKAVDIILKNTEEENYRNDIAKKVGRLTYSQVKIKGIITIENFQTKETTVTINKDLNGSVVSQSDNAKVTRNKNNSSMNPYSQLKWEVKLAANEKKTLTYEYEVYFVL